MMSNAMTNVSIFKNALSSEDVQNQLRASLNENAGAFISSVLDLYVSSPDLQKCSVGAVISECMKAAALKLPIVKSLGFAYIVPYKDKPTLTIGYKGLIQLAQRTGQYKHINADVVYEGELEGYDKLSGMIRLTGKRTSDKVIGYFAYFKLTTGFEKMLYMTAKEVEAWRDRYSPSKNSSFTPWKSEFDKMALKTVLRRLLGTYGALTIDTDLYNVVKHEEDAESSAANTIVSNANTGKEIGMDDEPIIDADGEIIDAPQPPIEELAGF